MKITGSIAACVLTIAVLVYGSFALYEGSWSLAQHNENHQTELITNGFGYQTALGQQITAGISAVNHDSSDIVSYQQQHNTTEVQSITVQRASDASDVCQLASQVNQQLDSTYPQTKWIDTNCSAGSLSPSSTYYVNG